MPLTRRDSVNSRYRARPIVDCYRDDGFSRGVDASFSGTEGVWTVRRAVLTRGVGSKKASQLTLDHSTHWSFIPLVHLPQEARIVPR